MRPARYTAPETAAVTGCCEQALAAASGSVTTAPREPLSCGDCGGDCGGRGGSAHPQAGHEQEEQELRAGDGAGARVSSCSGRDASAPPLGAPPVPAAHVANGRTPACSSPACSGARVGSCGRAEGRHIGCRRPAAAAVAAAPVELVAVLDGRVRIHGGVLHVEAARSGRVQSTVAQGAPVRCEHAGGASRRLRALPTAIPATTRPQVGAWIAVTQLVKPAPAFAQPRAGARLPGSVCGTADAHPST